jgi:hypothetical protein
VGGGDGERRLVSSFAVGCHVVVTVALRRSLADVALMRVSGRASLWFVDVCRGWWWPLVGVVTWQRGWPSLTMVVVG